MSDKVVEKLEDFALLTSYLEQIRMVGMRDSGELRHIVISSFNDSHLQDLLTDIIGMSMKEYAFNYVSDVVGSFSHE